MDASATRPGVGVASHFEESATRPGVGVASHFDASTARPGVGVASHLEPPAAASRPGVGVASHFEPAAGPGVAMSSHRVFALFSGWLGWSHRRRFFGSAAAAAAAPPPPPAAASSACSLSFCRISSRCRASSRSCITSLYERCETSGVLSPSANASARAGDSTRWRRAWYSSSRSAIRSEFFPFAAGSSASCSGMSFSRCCGAVNVCRFRGASTPSSSSASPPAAMEVASPAREEPP